MALVNDYEVVVRGLAAMLRSYRDRIEVVELDIDGEVTNRVDIALYDSFANRPGDRDGVRKLAGNPFVHKVIVYSWDPNDQLIGAVLSNGASGYIAKGLAATALVEALLAVHRGHHGAYLVGGRSKIVTGDWPGREEGLTQRESEVLALITQGLSNAEVAENAGLMPNTVKSYVRSCYLRIGVTTRAQAVVWAAQHGFVPDRRSDWS